MRIGAQRGQAIVLLAMMMAILVGFVALAIDSARAFDSRRILQDSVDAASLAAAESFQAGASWGTAQANAMTLFERDNRLYGGDNCSAGGFLTPTLGSPVTTTCTVGLFVVPPTAALGTTTTLVRLCTAMWAWPVMPALAPAGLAFNRAL